MKERIVAKIVELSAEGSALQRAGRYADAEVPLRRVVDLATTTFGPSHLETLRGTMNLAVCLRRRGDAQVALSMLSDVLDALRDADADGDRETAYVYRMALNNFAAAFRAAGRIEDARDAYLDCLTAADTEIAELAAERARVLDNLADVLCQRGELDDAEDAARQAHKTWLNLHGESSVEASVSISHLGAVALRRGDLTTARPLLEKALRLTEELSGPDHPRMGEMLNLVGSLELLSGNLDVAASQFERSLAIGGRWLLDTHPQNLAAAEALEQIDRLRSGG